MKIIEFLARLFGSARQPKVRRPVLLQPARPVAPQPALVSPSVRIDASRNGLVALSATGSRLRGAPFTPVTFSINMPNPEDEPDAYQRARQQIADWATDQILMRL